MALTERTFRVFVSSTFEDFVEERDLLHQSVFPVLTEFCRARGANFQAVDLRWGVSEQASIDHRAIDICLAEIERCRAVSPRPNFIVLIGERYGWCPPPREIPVDVFERIELRVPSARDRELLDRWYGRDNNAVPAVRYLRPRQGELRDYDAWEPVERRLRAILEEAVTATQWADDPRFVSSATEQEIVAGALTVPDAREHVFCFMRSIATDGAPEHAAGVAGGRLARLKARLRNALPTGVFEYRTSRRDGRLDGAYLDRLAEDVIAVLTRVISTELDLLEHVDPLSQEVAHHREFGAQRASEFTGREWVLAEIGVHLEQDYGGYPSHPLVIHGLSGAGKSALMARAAIDAERDHPNAVTVTRFLGCTPASTSSRDLVEGLCREIVRAYAAAPDLATQRGGELRDEATLPHEYNDLVRELPVRMGLASAGRPLHIFLDALDQLAAADPGHRLAWLPSQLPEHVRIVVSTTASSVAYRLLQARLPPGQLIALDRMDDAEGRRLLDIWLARAGRTLTPAQHQHVMARFELEGLPLYLKLAFEQARRWRSDESAQLAIGIRGVVRENLLARLAAEQEHGATLVAHGLGFLAAARNGLSDDELLDLLSVDGEVLADFRRRSPRSPVVDRLPPIVWSRLYFDLEPYLSEQVSDHTHVLTFYHRQLREVIEEEYLTGEEGLRRHRQLAEYFGDDAAQPLHRGTDDPAGVGVANLRRLSELPYQQTQARMVDAVTATLIDIAFLESKAQHAGVIQIVGGGDRPDEVSYVGVYQLQADYAFALSRLPDLDSVVEAFSEGLEREAHNLIAEPVLLFQQLYNRLQWASGRARDVMETERRRRATPFMHMLTRVREGAALRRTLAADSDGVADCGAIPGSGLIFSTGADPEVKIWDPHTGELVSQLVGHTGSVESARATPDGSRLVTVSRDKTVRIWDLATGAPLHTLPGYENIYRRPGCAVSPDGHFAVVVPAKDGPGAFNVWNLEDGAMISSFNHRKQLNSFAIGPDSATVAAGYSDGPLLTWNPLTGRLLATTVTHRVHELAFSPDGAMLVASTSASPDPIPPGRNIPLRYEVECRDSRTLDLLWRHQGHSFSIGVDGTVFVGRTDAVDVLNRRGESLTSFPGGPTWLSLSPDGTMLVSGYGAHSATVRDARTGQRLGDLVGHGGAIGEPVFTGGGLIATSCDDGIIGIWDTSRLHPADELPGHAGTVNAARISPDGRMVVSAGQTNDDDPCSVKLWSAADGSLLRAIDAHSGDWAFGALFGTDRNDLITSGLNEVAWWRGDDGRLIGRRQGASRLLASTEADWVVAFGLRDLMVLNARAELITTLPTESEVEHAAVTPDGHLMFGGRGDGVVLVWNVADWSWRTSIAAHADHISPLNSISAVAVSPDSRHGLSAGADKKVCIWELATGAQVRVLDHPAKVTTCGYTPDGTHIVSSAKDGSTWIWDAHEPAPGRLLARAPTPVRFCVVSPDGQFVITAHLDRSTTMRELATGKAVASIRLAGWSSSFDLHPWRPFLACGDQAGNVSLIEILGIEYGPIVVTARERAERTGLIVRCPRCRVQHHVDHAELGGEHRCPTPGCALPLGLNLFYSSKAPPKPADADPRSSAPAPSPPTDGDYSWASWEAEAQRLRSVTNQRDSAAFKKGSS